MKVVLDFQNLEERADVSTVTKHLDTMVENAKEAKGFLFLADRGEISALQVCGLSSEVLFKLISTLEEDHPELAKLREFSGMFRKR